MSSRRRYARNRQRIANLNNFDAVGREQYARTLAAALRDAGAAEDFEYDPDRFQLTSANEKYQINLQKGYREYVGASEPQQIVALHVRCWIESRKGVPDEYEDAAHDLLPSIRRRSDFERERLERQIEGVKDRETPHRVIADRYGAILVYERPNTIIHLPGWQLAKWGVSFGEAMAVACDNLRQISREGLRPLAHGVWVTPWQDNFDFARLLLTDLIEAHPVQGDPVILIPNRDTLLLTGSDDIAGIAVIAAAAESEATHPRAIHPFAVRLSFGSWTPFLPPVDHPSHHKYKLMSLTSIGQDYQSQKDRLVSLYETLRQETFVAEYFVLEGVPPGCFLSCCRWRKGLDTVLPRTDMVLFCDEERTVYSAAWEDVVEVVGDLMEVVYTYPERYRVRTFPTADQLLLLCSNPVNLA
jgi:hypothetical protein